MADNAAGADPEIMSEKFIACWRPTFTARPADAAAADKCSKVIEPMALPGDEQISLEKFSKIVAATKDSAPGPDGLRYSAHASHEYVVSVLYACILMRN